VTAIAGAETVVVEAAAEAVAEATLGRELETNIGAGSAKFVNCEETAAAAAACAGPGTGVLLVVVLDGVALVACAFALSFGGPAFRTRLTAVRMVPRA
jgi:hypothetical protein